MGGWGRAAGAGKGGGAGKEMKAEVSAKLNKQKVSLILANLPR